MSKTDFQSVAGRIVGGGEILSEEALRLLAAKDPSALRAAARAVTAHFKPRVFDFCAIVNARCGRCGEDCKWCAQSAHYETGCQAFGWIGAQACADAAKAAAANGVGRIAIVTSGRGQTPVQIEEICSALRAMRAASGKIRLCASLGLLDEPALARLKAAGLQRIHCNLETAPSHFGTLCTTHTTAEKLATIRAARRLGLEVCSGGIIGMGETDAQLVEFAFALKEIAPDSIPVNILDPIEGTPLGTRPFLDFGRILDAIAILRLVNPRTPLRFAGGRRRLTDEQAAAAIAVGIDAGIQGPLLTTPGKDYADDRQLALEAGYEVVQL
ncbi:MAG: biotin synthase BioB [Kiritimatiellia bacterium]